MTSRALHLMHTPRVSSTDSMLEIGSFKIFSESFLQCRDGERLHHSPCWLGFDHDNLSEHFPLASLCRRLQARLDHAQAGEHELTCALHRLRTNGFLQVCALRERLSESALAHGLGTGL